MRTIIALSILFLLATLSYAAVDSKVCDIPQTNHHSTAVFDSKDTITEGFEGGVIPPAGWVHIQTNTEQTWYIGTYNPYEGVNFAECDYDSLYTGDQDEWLISPALTPIGDVTVDFAWMGSYYWGVDPYDNYSLLIGVTDDQNTIPTSFEWDFDDEAAWTSWTWYTKTVTISGYGGDTIYIGFGYQGYDGAEGCFDAITIEWTPNTAIQTTSLGTVKALFN